ncbi:nicotinate-nicotinamide nucleotide adenylyltransferase [Acinetobacter rudis]|uniref:Cytidyltransferase-like domain-containing protein n=1 Tax=Acinetobacter rudis CIP 110305 TaxID=421052 RepID=S3NC18_9GAMM|nr:nicotinate-nicotinamide nucleotide adenylyltransferase [Acinetobacter rudis]EPF77317.1 hypothetical protein F945_00983 [Acinetobacter rudis CIP 110305]
MIERFDDLVYIGRFQPFHLAHMQTVQIALQQSDRVILALGSAQNQRNIKNPFTAVEREQMILSNFSFADQQRIRFVPIVDVYNDVKWVNLVKDQVKQLADPQANVGLIGHFKDDSSYYLELFPEWTLLELDSLKDAISATPLREAYYRGEISQSEFPAGTIAFLEKFKQNPIYQQLQQKYENHDRSDLNLLKLE